MVRGYQFRRDERAIEGLPVRLVVGIVVGVAAMGLIAGLIDGIDESGRQEATVQFDQHVVEQTGEHGFESVTLAVVSTDGEPISGAEVVVSGGSLSLADGPVRLETGPDSNEITLELRRDGNGDARVEFLRSQRRGTVTFDVVPPPGTDVVDDRANPELTVVTG